MPAAFDFLLHDPLGFATAATLLGLIVGSFLNVVIHRLPLMMERRWREDCASLAAAPSPGADAPLSLAWPGSRCPACGVGIGARDNLPILSWLLLGGRCRACGARISVRYPLIEAAAALLALLVVLRFGPGPQAAAGCVLTWALLALACIDLDTQYLPDDITQPLLWLGLLCNLGSLYVSLDAAVLGAVLGYMSLWSVHHLFRLVTGKEGMGQGDFKLLGALGAWLGAGMLPAIIVLSSLVGALVGIALVLLRGHDRRVPIPFGPFLAAAGWLALVAGHEANAAWLRLLTAR